MFSPVFTGLFFVYYVLWKVLYQLPVLRRIFFNIRLFKGISFLLLVGSTLVVAFDEINGDNDQ